MTSTLVYRYRGFNCRKKQFSRSYRNNLNSAWKKINAACLPFITNVCSLPRRLSYAFRGVQNANTETQFNGITVRFPIGGGGEKGEYGGGGRQGTIIVVAMRSFFFVSRNDFFLFTVRVLFNCKRISILYKSMS